MKNIITLVLLSVLFSVKGLNAQSIYNVTKNSSLTSADIPTTCTNCVINIANGVTLTINKDVYFQNVTFNGGAKSKSTIIANNHDIVFWSAGTFNNIIAEWKNVNLVNAGPLNFTNSVVTFTSNSVATVYTSISLVSSTWKLEDNSDMNATGGTFSIKNGSLTVGDGSASSKATAVFNGAQLSLLDATSFVTMMTNKNFYFNWSPYNGNGKSITTTNNNLNCGSGKSACSAPVLYGPASLTAGGISANAMLPVKLATFTAKSTNNTVVLNWITTQEVNSEVFEIERSVDGINWMTVGSVAAKGTSWTPSKYSYSEVVKGGSSFAYRLKMVDLDNEFEYSPIVKITMNGVAAGAVKTYPNPATNFFAVDGVSTGAQLHVVNMNGAVVKVINGYVPNAKVSLNGMLAGNYVVKVTDANGASQAFKLIVSR
ncbi:MAG: T9SS type A sorting domain-containing protein [Chitinophagaceae bacterium]|nr:T9SS type A sorting domain-containing protein [Chitinophagaceae bacterium]